MKLELEHQDTYGEIFLNTIYRISFLRNYHTEKSPVQVYISQSVCISVNENMKQTSEWSYKNRNTKRTHLGTSIAHAVIAAKDKQ
jgi:hypothetical protein